MTDNKEREALLPCPFCGEIANIVPCVASEYSQDILYRAICKGWHCYAATAEKTNPDAAAKTWNTRTQQQQPVDVVERVAQIRHEAYEPVPTWEKADEAGYKKPARIIAKRIFSIAKRIFSALPKPKAHDRIQQLEAALLDARDTIQIMHEQGNFDNGVYDSTGSICEGVVLTDRMVDATYRKIYAALGQKEADNG